MKLTLNNNDQPGETVKYGKSATGVILFNNCEGPYKYLIQDNSMDSNLIWSNVLKYSIGCYDYNSLRIYINQYFKKGDLIAIIGNDDFYRLSEFDSALTEGLKISRELMNLNRLSSNYNNVLKDPEEYILPLSEIFETISEIRPANKEEVELFKINYNENNNI